MKKLLALVLALLLSVTCLVACGEKADDSTDTGTATTSVDEDKSSEDDKDSAPSKKEEDDEDSAPSKKEEEDDSDVLTAKTLLGTWKGEMDVSMDGESISAKVEVEFKDDNTYAMTLDAKSFLQEMFTDEAALESAVGMTKEEFDQLLEAEGLTLDEFIDQMIEEDSDYSEAIEGTYSLSGGVMKLDDEESSYTYKNGKLTFSLEVAEIAFVGTLTLTKK